MRGLAGTVSPVRGASVERIPSQAHRPGINLRTTLTQWAHEREIEVD